MGLGLYVRISPNGIHENIDGDWSNIDAALGNVGEKKGAITSLNATSNVNVVRRCTGEK